MGLIKRNVSEICNSYLIKFITAYFGDVWKLPVLLQEASCSNTLALSRWHGEKTALEGELSTDQNQKSLYEQRGRTQLTQGLQEFQRNNQSLDRERIGRCVTSHPANQASPIWKLFSIVGLECAFVLGLH